MIMRHTKRWVTAVAAWINIALPRLSLAATLNVPGDFATIQACIDAAVSGVDECVVESGTYHETINFLGKGITLRSSHGADVTIIDATGLGGSVVTCATGEGLDTVLDGFTITGGTEDIGGGIRNYDSSPTVTHCIFRGNRALYGGGMDNTGASPTVTNCTFSANTASYYGGGMMNYSAKPTVTHCVFSGNTAWRGGSFYNWGGSPTLTHCTLSKNTASLSGGGMNNYDSSPTVTNCILWGDIPDEIVNTNLSAPTMGSNDLQGGLPVGAIDGGGNIDQDPMFVRSPDPGPDGTWDGVDDDYGDLRLQGGSPCIDAGDPGFVAQPGETDLEGHARVLCEYVDMGAYEFGIGDYDCDRAVDLGDFASWSSCMTGPQGGPYAVGCEAFDFNADGDVDFGDFSVMQCLIVP